MDFHGSSGFRLWFSCLGFVTVALGLGLRLGPARAQEYRTPVSQHLPKILGELRLVAVGDVMMHHDVKQAAQNHGFSDLWEDVLPLFKEADLTFANLETPVAPTSGGPGRPYQFNAPPELPRFLREAGFSLISAANNHAFDQGSSGLSETVCRLREEGLIVAGAGSSREEAECVHYLERKGVEVAFMALTDFQNLDLNGKSDHPWVNTLDVERALLQVAEARARADAVVVSVHWGDEYSLQPTKHHRRVAERLVAAGADLILGHHPHVLQPIELVESGGRRGLVAYSLGNFISNQDRMYRADVFPVAAGDNRDAVALFCTFSRVRRPDGHEDMILGEVGYEALWTRNNWRKAQNGQEKRRIRVIHIRSALDRVRRELDQLLDPEEGPRQIPDLRSRKGRITDLQEELRTLLIRKARIASIAGGAFERR